MTFDGKVEEIVYVNEESGYTVLNFSADDNYFTAVGIFPLIAEGEMLRISGEFKTNARFGEQFVVDRVEFYKPDTVEGIYKFLAGGLFRGVGEKTAMLIVNYFGLDTLKVLDKKADGTLVAAPEVVDRSRIYGAQTPQIFHSELLKKAYTQGFDTLFTDDASVARKYGIPLTFAEGERLNIKITTPEDLVLAQAILSQVSSK